MRRLFTYPMLSPKGLMLKAWPKFFACEDQNKYMEHVDGVYSDCPTIVWYEVSSIRSQAG